MQLLASWRDSLKMFYPLGNLKLFSLVVLRAVQESAARIALLLLGVLTVYLFDVYLATAFFGWFTPTGLAFFALALIIFLVRPSVGIKDFGYWYAHKGHVLLTFVVGCALIGFSDFIMTGANFFMTVPMTEIAKILCGLVIVLSAIALNIVFFVMSLWLFFFFDSRGSVLDLWYALRRAMRMAIYNLPVWLPFSVLTGIFFGRSVAGYEQGPLWELGMFTVWFAIQFLLACVWSVFYTKRLHEQFELYFPVKK